MNFAKPYELSKNSNSVCGILRITDDGSISRSAYVVDRERILSSIDAARTIASSTKWSTTGGCGNPQEAPVPLVLFRNTAFAVILDDAVHVWKVIMHTRTRTKGMNIIFSS